MESCLCTGLDLGGGTGKLEPREVLRAGARAMVLRGGATGLTGRVLSAQGREARALRVTRWEPETLSVSLHQHPPRS